MTHQSRRRLGLLGLLAFLLLLLLWPLFARGDGQAPYPLGVEQGGAVGGKKPGWLHIYHSVDTFKRQYHYNLHLRNRTAHALRVKWDMFNPNDEDSTSVEIVLPPRGAVEMRGLYFDPPVWRTGRLTLEVREGSKWRRVGSWWQSGPVPSKGK